MKCWSNLWLNPSSKLCVPLFLQHAPAPALLFSDCYTKYKWKYTHSELPWSLCNTESSQFSSLKPWTNFHSTYCHCNAAIANQVIGFSFVFCCFVKGTSWQQDDRVSLQLGVKQCFLCHVQWAQKDTRAAETNRRGSTCRIQWIFFLSWR